MTTNNVPDEALYFVEYYGTMQGTKIERAIKDYCRDMFHHRLCSHAGREIIYSQIMNMAQRLKEQWPTAKMPAIEFDRLQGRIRLHQDNAQDNFQLLVFVRIASVELGDGEVLTMTKEKGSHSLPGMSPDEAEIIELVVCSFCFQDMYEMTKHPRPWYKCKPELQIGQRLRVKSVIRNYYGVFYRCQLPEGINVEKGFAPTYDIPIDSATVIKWREPKGGE